MHVTAIIAAGGLGARFGGPGPKQLLPLGGKPILQHSVEAFLASSCVTDLVVALPAAIAASAPSYLRARSKPIEIVAGGDRRQDSVVKAFARVPAGADVVVIHDAARPLVSVDLIQRTIDAAAEHGAAIAALATTDTVKRSEDRRVIADTLPRNEIFLAQTPQAFRTEVLRDAFAHGSRMTDATDEAYLAERAGYGVRLVEGDLRNLKITSPDDLATAERLVGGGAATLRIGNGYDLHRLVPGRRLILAGVVIPFEKGLDGHSDADVVSHAVTDAILGAANAGDIGRHFPDTDPAWKDADSLKLLAAAADIVRNAGYQISNVDVVVIAERPKLVPHLTPMCENLARAMGISADGVSIKGKTNEGVGSIGAGESIAVHAVALISR